MRKLLALLPFFAILAYAEPPDLPALPDGGSLVTSTGSGPGDGGGPWITVDTGQVQDWMMALRCRSYVGSPSVHYRLSADAGTATTSDGFLPVNLTLDLPVSQGNGEKFRWLSLLGEDGGAPTCRVWRNPL
ncbi:MAG: hypothetical protein RLZZ403_1876 [Pseudomonadota bacterium]|jgi:hypothetical protein